MENVFGVGGITSFKVSEGEIYKMRLGNKIWIDPNGVL